MLFWISVAILAGNLAAFLVYGFDKAQARNDGWRVSEGTLILFALFGGVGAWTGCEFFRHKTRKQPFRGYLTTAVILHILVAFALVVVAPG